MKLRLPVIVVLTGALSLSACSGMSEHEMACAGGTFSGALVGGFIGNQFGGSGASNRFTTSVGAGAGAAMGASAAC